LHEVVSSAVFIAEFSSKHWKNVSAGSWHCGSHVGKYGGSRVMFGSDVVSVIPLQSVTAGASQQENVFAQLGVLPVELHRDIR
jgi:hypothetical protein